MGAAAMGSATRPGKFATEDSDYFDNFPNVGGGATLICCRPHRIRIAIANSTTSDLVMLSLGSGGLNAITLSDNPAAREVRCWIAIAHSLQGLRL